MNNTFISLGETKECNGTECITACINLNSTISPQTTLDRTISPQTTLDRTISHQTTLGSTINSTGPCVVIVKNVNTEPHCEGLPDGSISVTMSRALCKWAVACPKQGSQRGCTCCGQTYFKYTKCKEQCSYCGAVSASYGKLLSIY